MLESLGPVVPFFKMQGGGNDFVVIDNRSLRLPVDRMADWARQVCRKSFGIGADGLFFLEETPAGRTEDYIWHFYNADGSRAEMCGNASRCAARLAFLLGLAGPRHVLGTDRGPVPAEVFPDRRAAKVMLPTPSNVRLHIGLDIEGTRYEAHFVNTGVPHAVVLVDGLDSFDVDRIGRAVRFHPEFQPAGTNANFVSIKSRDAVNLRTYERGVEGETYACGTGAAATALVCQALGLTSDKVEVTTTGGEVLVIHLENGQVFLEGGAEIVFTGNLCLQSLGLELPAK